MIRFERNLDLDFTTKKSIQIKDGFLKIPLSEKEIEMLSLKSLTDVEIIISNQKLSLQSIVKENNELPNLYEIAAEYMKELDTKKDSHIDK